MNSTWRLSSLAKRSWTALDALVTSCVENFSRRNSATYSRASAPGVRSRSSQRQA